MSFPPAPVARLSENRGAIAPHQLWAQLTPSQQQPLRRALITVAQHLLANLPSQPPPEDLPDERQS
jgi:hypothetical protein